MCPPAQPLLQPRGQESWAGPGDPPGVLTTCSSRCGKGCHPSWKDPLVWRQEGDTRQGAQKRPQGRSGAQIGGSLQRE